MCGRNYHRKNFLSTPDHEKTTEIDTPSSPSANVSDTFNREQAIGSAPLHGTECKDMTAEDSDGVSSGLQTHGEKRGVNKNPPVLDEHGPVTLAEAVEKLGDDKDAEENVVSLRKEKSDQENSGRTSPMQIDFKDSITRLFTAQDITLQAIVASSSTNYTLALARSSQDEQDEHNSERPRPTPTVSWGASSPCDRM